MKTHILRSVTFYFSENRAGYGIMWRNMVARQVTDYSIIGRMRIACWITKATSTHWEDVILIFHGSSSYAKAPQCRVTRTYNIDCLIWRDVKTERTLKATHVKSRAVAVCCAVEVRVCVSFVCDLCSEVFSGERCVCVECLLMDELERTWKESVCPC